MSADDVRSDSTPPRRYVPDAPFPPYSYVTGRFPHPTRDPAGHSFGHDAQPQPAPEPNRWRDCQPFLWGVDLFNHGYYWEAHEVWESLWHACGRTGTTADFIKGLIKLAAAGVKAREGRPDGVERHGRRGAELFRSVAQLLPRDQTNYFGLSLPNLERFADALAHGQMNWKQPTEAPVEIVLPFALVPSDESLNNG